MVVLAQVVVVQVDERLDGLLHGAHLDQRHFAVLPGGRGVRAVRTGLGVSPRAEQGWGGGRGHSLEELEPLDDPAVAGEKDLQVVLRHRGPAGRRGLDPAASQDGLGGPGRPSGRRVRQARPSPSPSSRASSEYNRERPPSNRAGRLRDVGEVQGG